MPKLIVHGDADETVPLELGRRLHEIAAEPKELHVVARGGHNDLWIHGGLTYRAKLRRFCRRCLP